MAKWVSILCLAIVLMFTVNLSLGSVYIPLNQVFAILTGSEQVKESWQIIIIDFRLPKAFTAILVGAGLSISGLQMQTLFRNPLAGPFVLGISSGASLGVALLMLAGVSFTFIPDLNNWVVALSAALGSFLVLLVIVAVSLKIQDSMGLLIVGIMFGSLTSAVVSILQFFSSGDEIQTFLFWTFGSLGGLNWSELLVMGFIVILGLGIAIIAIKPLNALLLSENYARSMGVNVKAARLLIMLSTSLLAGSITAFCGPIAFIGLAVPHFSRLVFKTSDHKKLTVYSIALGILIMLTCDTIAQLPGSDFILPINAITSIIGAPFVIWIIIRRRQINNSF